MRPIAANQKGRRPSFANHQSAIPSIYDHLSSPSSNERCNASPSLLPHSSPRKASKAIATAPNTFPNPRRKAIILATRNMGRPSTNPICRNLSRSSLRRPTRRARPPPTGMDHGTKAPPPIVPAMRASIPARGEALRRVTLPTRPG